MQGDFDKRHKVSPCSSSQLQHNLRPEIQAINLTKCPPNCAFQLNINSCIYPNQEITLKQTLTLLLEKGTRRFDLTGHLVMDIKIERASN